MGYKWISLADYDLTDHSTPLYGIRLRQIGRNNYCTFVSEKEGLDCNNLNWDGGTTEEFGYYTYHRFNLNDNPDFYERNGSYGNEIWYNLPEETIEGVAWKTYTYPNPPLYWGGFMQPSNWDQEKYGHIQLKVKITFEPSKSAFNFKLTGGTDTFELTADSNWTATTASDWVSLNQYSGTTGGTISVTCDRNYTETARTTTITFTNANSETFNITVNQRKGTTEKEVNKMYRNGGIIFQRQMFSTRLSVSENILSFPKTGATQNVTVRSNAPYTVSASTDWITISTASTGIAVTVPNYTGTTERTGTITITANNTGDVVTKTISVEQKVAHYVSYIHTTTLSQGSNSVINTEIYPTTATTFRIIGQTKGYAQGSKVVGFNENDAGSDQRDYRLIWHGSGGFNFRWDFNSSELSKLNWGGAYDGRLIDFTCGNNYVYDNISQQNYVTGTTQSSMATTTVPIYVDCGSWWLKKLQIWQGETLVFDGEAAIEEEHIGLYDSVSGQLKYNPDLTMGYEE